ncbi:type II and III secretion system protein [Thiomicrorhabdus sp.]|uniref:type II and III secretion system protein n=1 Tax=Thiomicrorhabdus sp. TaxID=2039724 RepID=UPI0029C8EBB9|nr:type II and III secretion system protein [Thiomicrorhabdus sp.]
MLLYRCLFLLLVLFSFSGCYSENRKKTRDLNSEHKVFLKHLDTTGQIEGTSLIHSKKEVTDFKNSKGDGSFKGKEELISDVDPAVLQVYSDIRFSLNANQAPLVALLGLLAEKHAISLSTDIPPDYKVSLNAVNISFLTFLNMLKNQSVFYRMDDSGIFIYLSKPFWKTYQMDYVHLDKTGADNIDMKMSVSSTPTVNSVQKTSSGTRVKVESQHHFWKTLELNLQSFLMGQGGTTADEKFLINPESGVVSLYASDKVHFAFEKLLKNIRSRLKRQVLIEATVVEVTLNDQFKAGIDWSLFNQSLFGNSGGLAFRVPLKSAEGGVVFETLSANGDSGAVKFGNLNLLASLQLLQQFGDSKVLSSPKIMALNNQTALLKVVNNLVYFTVDVNTTSATSNSASMTTYETEVHTVPVGFTLSVTPFVGKNDQITLNIRPTISRHIGQVADPNPELKRLEVESFIPVIQEKEMSSVLKLRNGQIAMIGGLIEDLNSDDQNRLPFLAELPLIGKAFRSSSEERSRTELVIFIRPLIVGI